MRLPLSPQSSALAPSFFSLVFRARRRMIWKLRLERLAHCMAVACAAAVMAALAGIWMGRGGPAATGIILLCGALIGAAWAASVKVAALRGAVWLDQSLDLKDLLATAWSVRDGGSAWECSIVAMADSACRQADPGRVKPAVGNGQAWSAIVLGAALALTLGMIGPVVRQLNAQGSIAAVVAPDGQSSLMQNAWQADATRNRPAGDAALNEPSERRGGGDMPGDNAMQGTPGSGNDSGIAAIESGVAAGVGRTATQIAPLSTPAVEGGSNIQNSPRGDIAGGGSGGSPGSERSGVTGSAAGSSTPSAPPWQSVSWPAAQAAAMQSVQAGRVDPAYEPIVRDYFQRP